MLKQKPSKTNEEAMEDKLEMGVGGSPKLLSDFFLPDRAIFTLN